MDLPLPLTLKAALGQREKTLNGRAVRDRPADLEAPGHRPAFPDALLGVV
jgi:hypothetical protein